jgi:hypothetical protein
VNIAELLRVDRLGEGLLRERAGEALRRNLESAQAARPGLGQAEFYERLRQALPAALDVSLAEVIAAAWRRHSAPGDGMKIVSTHRCVVDLLAGDRLLCCIDVRAVVTLAVKPLRYEAEGDCIATEGEAVAAAELYFDWASVLKEDSRPVRVPRRIGLAPE